MPNPRYILGVDPTPPLLEKLKLGHQVFHANLDWFAQKYGLDLEDRTNMAKIEGVFLIGSHAEFERWDDAFSDVDFKLVNSFALPMNMQIYKKEVLDRLLHDGEKRNWVDMFFVQRDDQVMEPRYDLTSYWNSF